MDERRNIWPKELSRGKKLIADIYILISMETFEHRKYKTRGDEGIN